MQSSQSQNVEPQLSQSYTFSIKFLDIPVDGLKSNVVRGLVRNGFQDLEDEINDGSFSVSVYEGRVNGCSTRVYVYTNNNNGKVFRISSLDYDFVRASDAIIKYNQEIKELMNTGRYELLGGGVIDNNTYLEDNYGKWVKKTVLKPKSVDGFYIMIGIGSYGGNMYGIIRCFDNNNNAPADW